MFVRRGRCTDVYNSVPSSLLGFFFSVMDMSIVATALLAMVRELGDMLAGIWVLLAYMCAFAGKLAGIVG